MSDPNATPATGDGRDPEASGTALPRSYQPGSRLRQALDLARRAGAPLAETGHETHASMPLAEVSEPPLAQVPQPAEPPAAPEIDLAEPTITAEPGPRSPRRRGGLGRGLDALIPPNGHAGDQEPDTWETAAQGWVHADDGALEWRPIVTTLPRLDSWEVATYVGIVTGQAVAADAGASSAAASARERAVRSMVEQAVARGAHGVIGVSIEHAAVGADIIITATGTGVTLFHRR